jgi:hypothetical protein
MRINSAPGLFMVPSITWISGAVASRQGCPTLSVMSPRTLVLREFPEACARHMGECEIKLRVERKPVRFRCENRRATELGLRESRGRGRFPQAESYATRTRDMLVQAFLGMTAIK